MDELAADRRPPALSPEAACDAVERLAVGAGARSHLSVMRAGRLVGPHRHDNPYLSLYLLGSYRERGDGGETWISGPAAAYHPAGATHEDLIGERGLASIVVEFEAAWLSRAIDRPVLPGGSRYWVGGRMGRLASRLARLWLSGVSAEHGLAATQAYLGLALRERAPSPQPGWLAEVDARLGAASGPPRWSEMADSLGVSRPWLMRAYRQYRGEGAGEARRRRNVENAALLLARTSLPFAEVAIEAGFCDQSHMIRGFKLLTGRTPGAIRSTALGLCDVDARTADSKGRSIQCKP